MTAPRVLHMTTFPHSRTGGRLTTIKVGRHRYWHTRQSYAVHTGRPLDEMVEIGLLLAELKDRHRVDAVRSEVEHHHRAVRAK